jgi:hypothetical protein
LQRTFLNDRRNWLLDRVTGVELAAFPRLTELRQVRRGTTNGVGLFTTNFMMPSAMRRMVFSASGFLRSKIDGQGMLQSMISAAVRHGRRLPLRTSGRAWLAVGRLGPHDRLAVAARDHEEALADRRCAIVACAQLAELERVA